MTAPSRGRRQAAQVLDHPLLRSGMTILRDERTTMRTFRETLRRMSRLIAMDALADLRTRSISVQTPLARAKGWEVGQDIVLVPVLRAGLGLLDGFLDIVPEARVGHVGLYRDEETLEPVEYYVNLPTSAQSAYVVVLDPMLATGGSAVATLSLLRRKGIRRPVLATLIAAPEGIARVQKELPSVRIITCAIDARLNEKGFIVPGLGDAGDRLFGT